MIGGGEALDWPVVLNERIAESREDAWRRMEGGRFQGVLAIDQYARIPTVRLES